MHARTGTLQVDADKLDAVADSIKERVDSDYRDAQGYKGFVILGDRGSGKVIGISFWESEDDLQASDELGASARSTAAETGGSSSEPAREQFEVLYKDQA